MARGNIVQRNAVLTAVKAEDKAIANRPSGWTAGEAQRAHRAANAKHVAAIKAAKRA